MDIVTKAELFATDAHRGQKRKYTGENYIVHPAEVVGIVESVPHTKEMLAAAWLHDVVEDTDWLIEDIKWEFGHSVGSLVDWLTDVSKPSDGNRERRKQIDREHIAKAPPEAKTIKLADLISNSRSIVQHDPDFAKIYMREKELLMHSLLGGDQTLFAQAMKILEDYYGSAA